MNNYLILASLARVRVRGVSLRFRLGTLSRSTHAWHCLIHGTNPHAMTVQGGYLSSRGWNGGYEKGEIDILEENL